MIVPQNRLLLWAFALLAPLALLAAAEPAATIWSGAAIVLFLGIAVVDAFGARKAVSHLSLELPDVIRMSQDKQAKLELLLRNSTQQGRSLRLGLALPPQIQSEDETAWVALPAGNELSRYSWTCTPRKRGRFRINAAFLEAASPLGLWAGRRSVPAHSEVRVYPNLARERRSLAALFLNRGIVGLHAQRQIGKGRDFEKLREYLPGDSFDEIHWKATARRGHPITKVFQIEKTQEVYVILDASRLSARELQPEGPLPGANLETNHAQPTHSHAEMPPSPTATPLEKFITAALVLGLAAEQQGDLFGLMTFSDKVDSFVRARNGKAHYSACRDTLFTLEPRIVTPDFDEVCTFIRLRLRRRAMLVFLTSLDDPVIAENFVRNIDLLRRQHLVLVNMIQPPGVEPVFSNDTVSCVDDLYRHLGGHLLWEKLRELEKVLQRRGVRFSLLRNERLSTELVSQYLTVKQRQML